MMEDYGLYGRAAEKFALGSDILGHDYPLQFLRL